MWERSISLTEGSEPKQEVNRNPLIYNSYTPPQIIGDNLDPKAGLLDEIELLAKFDEKIKQYQRSEIVTDNYWNNNKDKFDKTTHVSETLLNNLIFIRDYFKDKLSENTIHSLLLRSIFIKYLEDRRDINNNSVFPSNFFNKFSTGAKCFTDLLDNKYATYEFFRALQDKFYGDIFNISKQEMEEVEQYHLKELKKLLTGEIYLNSSQTVLWPLYSFDLIPIELLSEIYQNFYHLENSNDENGTYYTPLHLVSFLIDEIIPWNNDNLDLKILDPACGSGIFLVESYKRLINTWMKKNNTKKIDKNQLYNIIKKSIFGVDLNLNALQVAALSLYLTICDYLEPRDIWNNLEFEELINTHLICSNFFEYNLFNKNEFNIIVGNPPWKSSLDRLSTNWIKFYDLPVGDKQICQAFLWKIAKTALKENGKCCLLLSSKALLFNRNKKNKEFRSKFFKDYTIEKIYNFSFIRRMLFTKAIGPSAAVLFTNKAPCEEDIITYINVKPSFTLKDDYLFEITSNDINHFRYDLILNNDYIWKIGMWGSVRDYELINRLSLHKSLLDIVNRNNWIHGEGFILNGGKQHDAPELFGMNFIETNEMTKFLIDDKKLKINPHKKYYRSSKDKREIFVGPHILIKQYPKRNEYGLISAISKKDIVFKDAIIGIHGKDSDLDTMSKCVLILNSKITTYYHALTSRNWLVERPALQKEEVMNTPMPYALHEINFGYNELLNIDEEKLEKMRYIIYDSFNISKYDSYLIEDFIYYTLDYFWYKENSKSVKKLNDNSLMKDYCRILCDILNSSFNAGEMNFIGNIYYDKKSPLLMIIIELTTNKEDKLITYDKLDELKEIDKNLIDDHKRSVYLEKEIILFKNKKIIIIKKNKVKNWLKSIALTDADYIYNKIMNVEEVI